MWQNPLETVDLVTFTEEMLNGTPHFLSCGIPEISQTKFFEEFATMLISPRSFTDTTKSRGVGRG